MSEKRELGRYKNPLGEYTAIEWQKLIESGEYENYNKTFSTKHSKCPPKSYSLGTLANYGCFFCEKCRNEAYGHIIIEESVA